MTAILIKPVSKNYFQSSKVGLRDIAVKRRAGTAILAERANPDGTKTQVFLIPEGAKVKVRAGAVCTARHMQTNRPYGDHTILGKFEFNIRNGIIQVVGLDVGTAAYSDAFEHTAVAFEVQSA